MCGLWGCGVYAIVAIILDCLIYLPLVAVFPAAKGWAAIVSVPVAMITGLPLVCGLNWLLTTVLERMRPQSEVAIEAEWFFNLMETLAFVLLLLVLLHSLVPSFLEARDHFIAQRQWVTRHKS